MKTLTLNKLQASGDRLLDLLTQQRHSKYFNQTRGGYLIKRVRVIAWLLVFVQPSWLIMDYFLLPEDAFSAIASARIVCAGASLVLALFVKGYNINLAYACLFFLVLILSGFNFASTEILIFYGHSTDVAGYQFFSFMIMAMMAVFPLTILEAFLYMAILLGLEGVIQVTRQILGQVDGINAFWLLSVLGVIATWSSVNQLSMLLTLYRQASRDPLTGLSNRRQAMGQMQTDVKQAHQQHTPLCALLFDLDKFKNFNDTYGHATGDLVLKAFSNVLLQNANRKKDLVCRYGGEEFLVVLQADISKGCEVAEKIRQSCHEAKVRTPNGNKVGFTTSVGVACLQQGEDIESLLQRADTVLYAAKDHGRDQVKVAQD